MVPLGIVDLVVLLNIKMSIHAFQVLLLLATYPGYYFTVDGDDNPYVNINITAGGVGDTRAKLLTEYSSIDLTR